jgi:hypothetical protein
MSSACLPNRCIAGSVRDEWRKLAGAKGTKRQRQKGVWRKGKLLTLCKPLSWVLRSFAHALALSAGVCLECVTKEFPDSRGTATGLGATYLIFAGIGVVALGSIYATVPETKGKTLEEIAAMWDDNDQSS